MDFGVTLDQYYQKREMLEGLLTLQFGNDPDFCYHRQALAYVMGQDNEGVGSVARYLTWRDNTEKFFSFLDDFDVEMLPSWRQRREMLARVVWRQSR